MRFPEVSLRFLSRVPIDAGTDASADTGNPSEWTRYIRTTDIASLTTLDPDKVVTVPDDVARLAPVGRDDILMTRAGSLGTSYIHESDEPAAFAGYLVRWRVDTAKAYPKYMAYWTVSKHFQTQISTGAVRSTIDNYSASKYRSTRAPLPGLEEQRRIADFLDAETAQIDALIAEQERFIALLRERRAGLVKQAIAPHGRDAKADKLGRHARITNGSTPRRDIERYWSGGGFPWLNSAVVNRDEVTSSDQFVTSDALRECHLPITRPGDLLVALTGQGKTRGRASIVRIEATINQHLACISPDRTRWDPDYLLWSLRSSYDDLRRQSDEAGATKGALTVDALLRHRVVMPPLFDQRRIVGYLGESTGRIDMLIAEAEHNIALSNERRSALITAAVTGQIDATTGRAA